MPLLDERGRLFGRVNLIDAAVAVFVLLLIPLGYGAYVLFRAPVPVVTNVTPRAVKNVKGEVVEIQGRNLRPFLRATLGPQPVEYLFATPDLVKLTLPEMAEGDYELILYDESQEVARGGTIQVRAPAPPARPDDPIASVAVVGAFHRLDIDDAQAVRAGAKYPATRDPKKSATDWLEVVAAQPPTPATIPLVENNPVAVQFSDKRQVVARVRLEGRVVGKELMFGDKRVLPGVELALPREEPPASPVGQADTGEGAVKQGPAPAKLPIAFVIQRVYPERTTPVDVQVRFIVRPDVLALVLRDVGHRSDPFRALLPQVLSLDVKMALTGDTKNDLKEGTVHVAEGVVRFPAVRTVDGWSYDNRVIRPGTDIAVETPEWGLIGNVLSMTVRGEGAKR